eukprot:668803-Lingulodinium_polyedra.AAC.1
MERVAGGIAVEHNSMADKRPARKPWAPDRTRGRATTPGTRATHKSNVQLHARGTIAPRHGLLH